MFDYYYNGTLRKIVVAFGSLFDEIYVQRTDSEGVVDSKIRVPIGYSSKEKFIQRLQQQSGISDSTKVQLTLPRMGFELSSIDYDPTRHLNKLNKRIRREEGEAVKETFQEVPYNVGFSLFVFTRSMEENLQIAEQILPQFAPEFIVTLKMNEIDSKLDVPISLTNFSIQETYDGNFLDRRIIASSFNFSCKVRLYSQIKDSNPVVSSYISIDELTDSDDIYTSFTTGATGSTLDFTYGDIDYGSWIRTTVWKTKFSTRYYI